MELYVIYYIMLHLNKFFLLCFFALYFFWSFTCTCYLEPKLFRGPLTRKLTGSFSFLVCTLFLLKARVALSTRHLLHKCHWNSDLCPRLISPYLVSCTPPDKSCIAFYPSHLWCDLHTWSHQTSNADRSMEPGIQYIIYKFNQTSLIRK